MGVGLLHQWARAGMKVASRWRVDLPAPVRMSLAISGGTFRRSTGTRTLAV